MGTRRGFIRGLATGIGGALTVRGTTALAGVVTPQICDDSRFPHARPFQKHKTVAELLLSGFQPLANKTVIGSHKDVGHIRVGDVMRCWLEMKGEVFEVYPHNSLALVTALYHEDDEYFYWLPIVAIADYNERDNRYEHRMFNPEHLRRAE